MQIRSTLLPPRLSFVTRDRDCVSGIAIPATVVDSIISIFLERVVVQELTAGSVKEFKPGDVVHRHEYEVRA